jgi:HSP20 family protein
MIHMKLALRKENNWVPSLMDEIFKNDSISNTDQNRKSLAPPVNVSEREDQLLLQISIPGFNKEDVSIEIEKQVLIISSKVAAVNEEIIGKFTRKEFCKQSFKRSFNLPKSVYLDQIDATYENGILSVILPKKEEDLSKPKRRIFLK